MMPERLRVPGPKWKMEKLFMLLLLAALALFAPPHAQADGLDVHKLPLGDGKVSGAPEQGYVMSCTTSFSGGGALATAPWIHGNTWDLTQKISVRGKVVWPQAQFEITTVDKDRVVSRIVQGNGLPLKAATGTFPIAQDDPAYRIDRNPNTIMPSDIVLKLPMTPQFAAKPSCLPMGMIAVGLNGVAIFNALDGGGRDAVAHEAQDLCNGHPQPQGQYHYHGPSACLPNQAGKEVLIGYALDGFGIYSMYDAQGYELTDADLDECHGRTSEVEWDGARRVIYHYVLTQEYPYTIGCFQGSPVRNTAGK